MYRISVTTLEKFRRYMADTSSFDSEEALLESIKGIFKGNPKTEFGGAYHKIIEGAYKMNRAGNIATDGYVFTPDQAQPALDYRQAHPQIIAEMDVRKVYTTAFFPVQVSGRVDAVEGLCVRDAKTKFRAPNYQEYIDSCQWKFYLDMLEANVFYYDLFEIKRFNEDTFGKGVIFPEVVVLPHEPLQCLRYSALEGDITSILNDFIEYTINRNLFAYLKPAILEEPLFS